ncbi:MAG: type II secretion system protein [Betaproteobacteria bacterium]|nr:type II secretion system protein [Betaproteobacteria bacterium]
MSRQQGFTYLAVIFMVAVAGIILAATGTQWSSVKAREDAEQLRFVGEQFRRAIGSYYEQSPGGAKHYPRRLEDLLKDDRYALPKRHLRQIYANPKTGRADWNLVTAPDGGVMGIVIPATDTSRSYGIQPHEFVYRPFGLPADAMQTPRGAR